MSANLQQMQINYDQIQDRLTLIFFTQNFCEYRFWITRRVTSGFCGLLKKLINEMSNQKQQKEEERKADALVHRERPQPEANKFATRITQCPLGETPLLLYRIRATPTQHGTIQLHLEDIGGTAIDFTADLGLLNVLSQLVHKAVLQTDWNQPIEKS